MRVLGAILAGGQSRRFGSDKASASLDGKSLLDHVADALGTAPSIASDLPIIGLWPVALRTSLLEWLADPQNRSVYAFAAHIGARKVDLKASLRNVNRPEDLA